MTTSRRELVERFLLVALIVLVLAIGISTLIAGGEPSVAQITTTLVVLQLCAGAVIVALNGRAAFYLRRLWQASQTETHPERSWLLRALVTMTLTVIAACSWFLVTIAIAVVFGVQPWLRPINIAIIIAVLTVPIRLVREFRRRERAARDHLRVADMPDPDW